MKFSQVVVAVVTAGGMTVLVCAAPPAVAGAMTQASVDASLQAGVKVKYYKSDYQYRAVRIAAGGSKARVIWTGDGPGACFVGTRSGAGPFRGIERNLAGGTRRVAYSWSQLNSGQRVSPPGWLKKATRTIWKRPGCR
jgi:hypothetical protein